MNGGAQASAPAASLDLVSMDLDPMGQDKIDETAGNVSSGFNANELGLLYAGELVPVGPRAQRKVPVPEGKSLLMLSLM